MRSYQIKFRSLFTTKELKYSFRNKIVLKNTRGLDGICNEKFRKNLTNNIEIIQKKIFSGEYKFTPYLEKLLIKRKNSFPRQIAIPSKRDQLVLFQLKEFITNSFKKSIITKLPNEYIKEILSFVVTNKNNLNDYILIKSDIVGFYDNINREKLMNKIRRVFAEPSDKIILKLIYIAISNYIVPKNYHKSDNYKYLNPRGIPQGLAISNILANIYLAKFDKLVSTESELYLRYVDDFLIIIDKNKLSKINNIMNKKLKRLSLELNKDKSSINSLSSPFDYLGYRIHKGLITVRRTSIEVQIKKIAYYFKYKIPALNENNKINEIRAEVFIEDLNEIITGAISDKKRYGWLFYYSQINDIKILYELDRIVTHFFKRSKFFEVYPIKDRKYYVKAYYKIRSSNVKNDPYFQNYSLYKNRSTRTTYLIKREYITLSEAKKMSATDISDLFNKVKEKNLKRLEKDDHNNRY